MLEVIEEWLSILSDPGHVLAETTFLLAEITMLTPLIRWLHGRWVRKHDAHAHPPRAKVEGVVMNEWEGDPTFEEMRYGRH